MTDSHKIARWDYSALVWDVLDRLDDKQREECRRPVRGYVDLRARYKLLDAVIAGVCAGVPPDKRPRGSVLYKYVIEALLPS